MHFWVTSGKLLGHIVSERGIEVYPDKIKAIQEMPVPKTEKYVQGLLENCSTLVELLQSLL